MFLKFIFIIYKFKQQEHDKPHVEKTESVSIAPTHTDTTITTKNNNTVDESEIDSERSQSEPV